LDSTTTLSKFFSTPSHKTLATKLANSYSLPNLCNTSGITYQIARDGVGGGAGLGGVSAFEDTKKKNPKNLKIQKSKKPKKPKNKKHKT
jgi:hypothetical protein